MRGRHFGFLVSLSAVWITARVGFLSISPPPEVTDQAKERQAALPRRAKAFAAIAEDRIPPQPAVHLPKADKSDLAPTRTSWGPSAILPEPGRPLSAAVRLDRDEQPQKLAQPFLIPTTTKAHKASPLTVYAYSFIRARTSGPAPLGSSQYGGSQSGIIATYALAPFGDKDHARLAVLLRGAIAHDNAAERELAAGLRWHPVRNVPLNLTAERRFRHARSDAFAAYAAGGVSEAKLPLDFRLDAYAQAGFVTRKNGGAFFDASARAERSVADVGAIPVRAGVGIWAGGQEDIFRIDAGPTISGDVLVANTRLRISADWRFRIAGNAQPAAGPALTLSTAF